jgi:hypothetical protein
MGYDFLQAGNAVEVKPSEPWLRRRQGVVRGANGIGLFLTRVRDYTPDGWRLDEEPVEEFIPWTAVCRVELLKVHTLTGEVWTAFDTARLSVQFAQGTGRTVDADDTDSRR